MSYAHCSYFWSWSLNPIIIMQLLSISYIAAALAAIAGSAMAAPVPFYARDLEQVDSFERNLGVNLREPAPHQLDHFKLAKSLVKSKNYNMLTIEVAQNHMTSPSLSTAGRKRWKTRFNNHRAYITNLNQMKMLHLVAASSPYNADLHLQIPEHKQEAWDGKAYARATIAGGLPRAVAGH